MPRLFCLGTGYVAERFARSLVGEGWRAAGTTRDPARAAALQAGGIEALVLNDSASLPAAAIDAMAASHAWLVSAAPTEAGDPFLPLVEEAARTAPLLPRWVGYLSTTGVYGDTGGAWVDENTPPAPDKPRTARRVSAETAWLDLADRLGAAGCVFRLGGIYGPGRSVLDKLREGAAHRVVKPGKVFNRIHVDDIVRVLTASLARPRPRAVYNVVDEEPLAPGVPVEHACTLLGREPPPEVEADDPSLSAALRGFYEGNVRVRSAYLRPELGVELLYPDVRRGVEALVRALDDDDPLQAKAS